MLLSLLKKLIVDVLFILLAIKFLKNSVLENRIPKDLIYSYISHEEFVSLNNVLREYYEMREEIKNIIEKQWRPTVSVVKKKYCKQKFKCQKTKQLCCSKKKLTFIKNQELSNGQC